MERKFKLICEDNPRCSPFKFIDGLPTTPIDIHYCFALNCSKENRIRADPQEFLPVNICEDLESFEKLITKAKKKKIDKYVFFYGYHVDAPLAIRSYLCYLLDNWQPHGRMSIIVSTDNLGRHDPIFYASFNLPVSTNDPNRRNYCSRCRQTRNERCVVHFWYPLNKTITGEDRCETCKNMRNEDIPGGGLRKEGCDCRHTEDFPVHCITCRTKVGEYMVWDENIPNENAWIKEIRKQELSSAQYVYCSMKCRKAGKVAKHHPQTCWVCREPGKACGGCEKIYYCSPEHQKEDWENHKDACKLYRTVATLDP